MTSEILPNLKAVFPITDVTKADMRGLRLELPKIDSYNGESLTSLIRAPGDLRSGIFTAYEILQVFEYAGRQPAGEEIDALGIEIAAKLEKENFPIDKPFPAPPFAVRVRGPKLPGVALMTAPNEAALEARTITKEVIQRSLRLAHIAPEVWYNDAFVTGTHLSKVILRPEGVAAMDVLAQRLNDREVPFTKRMRLLPLVVESKAKG